MSRKHKTISYLRKSKGHPKQISHTKEILKRMTFFDTKHEAVLFQLTLKHFVYFLMSVNSNLKFNVAQMNFFVKTEFCSFDRFQGKQHLTIK